MDNKTRILIFDLETTANQGFYWGQNWETGIIETIEYWKILSYAAKWLDDKKVIVRGWIDTKNELGLVKELWKLLDEADIAIAHNGKKFDIKKCNAKFALYGLGPPSPYKVIDTLNEARKYLSLPSYRLNDISNYFRLGQKVEHEGWVLWKKCIAGDKSAWNRMKSYNKHDVILLENVYLKLRPFINNHPTLGMFTDKVACPNCGSGRIQSRGTIRSKTTEYKRACCMSCSSWMRIGPNLRIIKPAVSI